MRDGENLIQAFSRTNRLCGPDKPFGAILYFRKPHTMKENIEAALKLVAGDEEAFVMGGATMYRLFLPHADKLYLTRIVSEFTADVWFPEIDENEWKVVESEFVPKDEKNVYDLYFQTLIRQK